MEAHFNLKDWCESEEAEWTYLSERGGYQMGYHSLLIPTYFSLFITVCFLSFFRVSGIVVFAAAAMFVFKSEGEVTSTRSACLLSLS